MATASWMKPPPNSRRTRRVRRTKGRRASDGINLESILIGGVIVAWSWGIYEVTLYFVR